MPSCGDDGLEPDVHAMIDCFIKYVFRSDAGSVAAATKVLNATRDDLRRSMGTTADGDADASVAQK
jgi:hypothetical protein